jgi:hypothetical protein
MMKYSLLLLCLILASCHSIKINGVKLQTAYSINNKHESSKPLFKCNNHQRIEKVSGTINLKCFRVNEFIPAKPEPLKTAVLKPVPKPHSILYYTNEAPLDSISDKAVKDKKIKGTYDFLWSFTILSLTLSVVSSVVFFFAVFLTILSAFAGTGPGSFLTSVLFVSGIGGLLFLFAFLITLILVLAYYHNHKDILEKKHRKKKKAHKA